jgi:uncharacterized membrane protein
VTKSRLEAFCDGVFAIAITLLVLDLTVPDVGAGQLSTALRHEWPAYVAYVVSFVTIGIMWINHHVLMRHFSHVDRAFLVINVLFLMVIAFVPFPTGVIADALKAPRSDANLTTAALLYGFTMVVQASLFNAVWHYGRLHLMHEKVDAQEASGITRTYAIGPAIYLLATLTALLNPYVALSLFLAIAVFYLLSASFFGTAEL